MSQDRSGQVLIALAAISFLIHLLNGYAPKWVYSDVVRLITEYILGG